MELVPDEPRWHQDHPAESRWFYDGPGGHDGILIRDETGIYRAMITTNSDSTDEPEQFALGDRREHAKLAVEAIAAIAAGTDHGRTLAWIAEGPAPSMKAIETYGYEGPFGFSALVTVSAVDEQVRLTVIGTVKSIRHDDVMPSLEDAKQTALSDIRTQICSDLQLDIRHSDAESPLRPHCRHRTVGCSLAPPPIHPGPPTAQDNQPEPRRANRPTPSIDWP
ncbi:hypothetical protein OG225_41890 (plasmid) [Nocardia sp. NBC_01377]